MGFTTSSPLPWPACLSAELERMRQGRWQQAPISDTMEDHGRSGCPAFKEVSKYYFSWQWFPPCNCRCLPNCSLDPERTSPVAASGLSLAWCVLPWMRTWIWKTDIIWRKRVVDHAQPCDQQFFSAVMTKKCKLDLKLAVWKSQQSCTVEILTGNFGNNISYIDMHRNVTLKTLFVPKPDKMFIHLVTGSNSHVLAFSANVI